MYDADDEETQTGLWPWLPPSRAVGIYYRGPEAWPSRSGSAVLGQYGSSGKDHVSRHGPHGIRATQGWRRGVSCGWNCDLPTVGAWAGQRGWWRRSAGYILQRWLRDARCISGSNQPLWRYVHSKLSKIKCKKLISLQHGVRAMKSHIQNSTNHFFSGIMW